MLYRHKKESLERAILLHRLNPYEDDDRTDFGVHFKDVE